MTDYPIQQQVQDIREVFSKAAETKETALQFLKDAGIIATTTSNDNKRTVAAECTNNKK